MPAALDDYHWLTSDAATPWLARAAEFSGELTRLIASLRKDLSADRAHLVVEQADLRRRAREKFALADKMFFTRKGFEQATDEAIATYKASRLRDLPYPAVDLCCGVGGDLIALARWSAQRSGQAVGIDLDPITAHLASVNCRVAGENAEVLVQDATLVDLDPFSVVHLDPDRRADGQRHTRFEDLTPGPEFFETIAERNLAIKLAPATDVPAAWAERGEREWIGSRGECRQQMLWCGIFLGSRGGRSASVVGDDGRLLEQVGEVPEAELQMSPHVRRFIFEPHAAVLAAKLAASLAFMFTSLSPVTALTIDGGYLTGDHSSSWKSISTFEVLEVLPFDLKKIKSYLRARNVGRLEVKKRGVADDPELVRKKLDLRGDQEATLILARTPERVLAIVARRL